MERSASVPPSRQRPASAGGGATTSVVLKCPETARPGQTVTFMSGGAKCQVVVPEGVAPGTHFKAMVGPRTIRPSASAKSLGHAVIGAAMSKPPRPKSASAGSGAAAAKAVRRQPKVGDGSLQWKNNNPDPARTRPGRLREQAALDSWDETRKNGGRVVSSSPRVCNLGGKLITKTEMAMVNEYRQRVRNGLVGDENYWRQFGFKIAGGQTAMSEEKARDYGFGIPKWSPYYHGAQLSGDTRAQEAAAARTNGVGGKPGDQGWWQQWGFKGSLSEEKRRDYGDGVPMWSMYYHSKRTEEYPPELTATFPGGDAAWFKQFGFRPGGELTEEKKRDYGYGIPKWSPMFVPSDPSHPSEE